MMTTFAVVLAVILACSALGVQADASSDIQRYQEKQRTPERMNSMRPEPGRKLQQDDAVQAERRAAALDLLNAIIDNDRTKLIAALGVVSADFTYTSDSGTVWSPLVLAIVSDRTEFVQILLFEGADPNIMTGDTNPLEQAAIIGSVPILEALLKAGADVSAKDKEGFTALHLAAFNNHPEAVALLIENGSPINAKDTNGFTPLFTASLMGHKAVVQVLLKAGADQTIGFDADGEDVLPKQVVCACVTRDDALKACNLVECVDATGIAALFS